MARIARVEAVWYPHHVVQRGNRRQTVYFQDADKAVEDIVNFYSNYHSSRFFKNQYLIRLKTPITEPQLKKISIIFKDILSQGVFERFTALQEDDNPDPKLERILFYFDRASYSRLRQLIDYLNTFPNP